MSYWVGFDGRMSSGSTGDGKERFGTLRCSKREEEGKEQKKEEQKVNSFSSDVELDVPPSLFSFSPRRYKAYSQAPFSPLVYWLHTSYPRTTNLLLRPPP